MSQSLASESLRGHRRQEGSLRLQRAVADNLRRQPEVLARARNSLQRWQSNGLAYPRYTEAWDQRLALSRDDISDHLVDCGKKMISLATARLQLEPIPGENRGRSCFSLRRLKASDAGEARARRPSCDSIDDGLAFESLETRRNPLTFE